MLCLPSFHTSAAIFARVTITGCARNSWKEKNKKVSEGHFEAFSEWISLNPLNSTNHDKIKNKKKHVSFATFGQVSIAINFND